MGQRNPNRSQRLGHLGLQGFGLPQIYQSHRARLGQDEGQVSGGGLPLRFGKIVITNFGKLYEDRLFREGAGHRLHCDDGPKQ